MDDLRAYRSLAARCGVMLGVALVSASAMAGVVSEGPVEEVVATDMLASSPALTPIKAGPVPASVRSNVPVDPGVALFFVNPPDVAALRAEDELLPPEPLRTGVAQAAHVPFSETAAAEYATPDGGRLWTMTLVSPGAQALRVHFEDVALPDGAELWVYAPGAREAAQGPFDGQGPLGTGSFWTGVTPGDEVVVEYHVPAEAKSTGRFSIGELGYLYRGFEFLSGDGPALAPDCQLDVLCYAAWHPLHNATCRMTYADGGYVYNCSATLINTTTLDETPYLLTANHCISDNTVANTLTVDWFYQTVSCNGAAASFSQSTHAYVVETRSSTDQTLLMLRGSLPPGVVWAGWSTTESLNTGTDLVGIHHPGGARKKISFGDKINHPWGDNLDYWGISWTDGTIEQGSSGSACYLVSNQRVVGVASHSASPIGCSNPDGPSGYGKFGRFYDFISGDLTAGADDSLENNDSCSAARSMTDGTYSGVVVKSTDEDWYHVQIPIGASLTANATFSQVWGDIDMELYDGCGGTVVASATSNSSNETLILDNRFGTQRDFYLRVYLDADTRQTYNLQLVTDCYATPSQVANVVATDGDECDRVIVTWDGVSGAVDYTVWRSASSDPNTATEVGTTTALTLDDTTVTPEVTYYYWVVAANDCHSSAYGTPDTGFAECAPQYDLGDMNCDGAVDVFDINPFVEAVLDSAAYEANHPGCAISLGDINGDGFVDVFDINPFVELVLNP